MGRRTSCASRAMPSHCSTPCSTQIRSCSVLRVRLTTLRAGATSWKRGPVGSSNGSADGHDISRRLYRPCQAGENQMTETHSPNGEQPIRLHPDFGHLGVIPGHADIRRSPELFNIINIVALGGAEDMHPHIPNKVGQVGTAVFWESTGAADALPFWNTNLRCDVLL